MSKSDFDVIVIGAGPGGYVAAIRAARNGARTALVEREFLGGTCLNWGCIPTKTLIASVEVLHQLENAAGFGIKVNGKPSADWEAMQKRKSDIIGNLRKGIAGLLKNAGVSVFQGNASFIDRRHIRVSTEKGKDACISGKHIIVATGSAPAMPGFIPQNKRILDSTAILELEEIPKQLIVLGGGVIGCEFACLFNGLGVEVTIVELLPQILPMVDDEISRLMTMEMKKAGIKVLTGNPMTEIKATTKSVSGKVKDAVIKADYLLVSVGRKPVTSGLNPEAIGLSPDKDGFIRVDNGCRTSIPGIFAIGDLTGRVQLAHMASAMAVAAADNASGKRAEFSDDLIPNCIFTSPEIGSLGLSSEQCSERGIKTKVGKFPFAALGKAMAIGETSGFVKIIADDQTDQILGIHIIGPHATDLIAEASPAMQLEITASELGQAIHAHPTLGEAIMEAAHAVHGESIHTMQPTKRSG